MRRLLPNDLALADARLEALRADVTAAVQSLRLVIADLRPPALDDLGLGLALELLVRLPAAHGG